MRVINMTERAHLELTGAPNEKLVEKKSNAALHHRLFGKYFSAKIT